MEFLNPLFLYGLFALAIPVLIHLFNLRRYRKEYFTNVSYLTQITLETRKRSRLKQWLILAARLLAIASLVLAFSQPFIPSPLQGSRKPGSQAVSIYVDNSWSMEAIGSEGRLLDIAKKRAADIASACKASDIFQLVTNDLESKHSQFVSREEFLGLLREVRTSHTSISIKELILRQKDLFSNQGGLSHLSYLVSDFQKTTGGLDGIKPDSNTHYILVPVESLKQNNLFIDSVWFPSPVHRPGQAVKLTVKISNCGSEGFEKIPLRLYLNEIQKSVTNFSIEASQSVEISLPYTEGLSGFQQGRLEIADYPVVYDDRFWFTYNITDRINVLTIYGKTPGPYLGTLFGTDSVFNFSSCTANQVDYSSFGKQNLILVSGLEQMSSGLAGELKMFLEKGGSLCIFPPTGAVNETFNNFYTSLGGPLIGKVDSMKQRVSSIDIENELFKDVFDKDAQGKIRLPDNADLPLVMKYFQLTSGTSNPATVVMRLENGLPFLTSLGAGKGRLYQFAAPLDPAYSNFQQHLLFLPVLYRMAFLSEARPSLYYTIGRTDYIDLPTDSVSEKNMVRIAQSSTSFEFIPEIRTSGQQVRAFTHDRITEAGWYNVYRGNKKMSVLAFDYDKRESDINCFTPKELESDIKKYNLRNFVILKPSGLPFIKQVEQLNMGFPLWKWFILLALLFLASEILIIRFLRS